MVSKWFHLETSSTTYHLHARESPKWISERKPELLDQEGVVASPRQEPKPDIQETNMERWEAKFRALTHRILDARLNN